MTLPTTLATPTTLALRVGSSRHVLAVADYAEASRVYRIACDAHERAGHGSSTMPRGAVLQVTGAAHRVVARVSWNGRVWPANEDPLKAKPLYDPYATGGAA